tara:strand:- start:49803 stop:50147 length:345 start_codon:yes stop_codon:yes gene_type:complete
MESLKEKLSGVYAWMIILGLILGPFGLVLGYATVSAIGNSLFLAGFVTPVFFHKTLSAKDATFGGLWLSSVLYFVSTGDVDGIYLLTAIPLFTASVLISKWSESSFTQTPQAKQ